VEYGELANLSKAANVLPLGLVQRHLSPSFRGWNLQPLAVCVQLSLEHMAFSTFTVEKSKRHRLVGRMDDRERARRRRGAGVGGGGGGDHKDEA